jgi:hypothetical protein
MPEVNHKNDIKKMNAEQLRSLVDYLRNSDPDVDTGIDEWLSRKGNISTADTANAARNRLALSYWSSACSLINDMNEYGGADDEDYEEAADWIEKLQALIKIGLENDTRAEIFEEAFEQYRYSNSGFDDNLMDLMMDLCLDEGEWKLFADKLLHTGSHYDKEVAMDIMTDKLHNDSAYLEMRRANLRFGADYFDLATHYMKRKKNADAIKTAEEGIIKGEGRVDDLFDLLFDHYSMEKKGDMIDFLLKTSIQRETYEAEILYKAFMYFNRSGDYTKAIVILGDLLNFRKYKFYEFFLQLKKVLKAEDLEVSTKRILELARKHDLEGYMKICLDLDQKDKILQVLEDDERKNFPSIFQYADLDRFANALVDTYPETILHYFLLKAERFIGMGKRENYRRASGYLDRVEEIECKVLHQPHLWNRRIIEIIETNRKRFAFLEEYQRHKGNLGSA